MSIHSSSPADKASHADFAITAPRRHDRIGSALNNAFARPAANDVPDDMVSLLAQLDQQTGQRGASE